MNLVQSLWRKFVRGHREQPTARARTGTPEKTTPPQRPLVITRTDLPDEERQALAEALALPRAVLDTFLHLLAIRQVDAAALDETLRRMAERHRAMRGQVAALEVDDPVVVRLRAEALDAIDGAQFTRGEALLNEASAHLVATARGAPPEVERSRLLAAASAKEANARMQEAQLQHRAAADYYRAAVDFASAERIGPHPDWTLANLLLQLGAVLVTSGDYAAAEGALLRAREIGGRLVSAVADMVVGGAEGSLARLYERQGRYAEAGELYGRTLSHAEHVFGPKHPSIAAMLDHLAVLYKKQGRDAEAEPLYRRALAIREAALGPEHPDTAATRTSLAGLLEHLGRTDQAGALRARSPTGLT
jgi:tetratricopeptide (TPR) repeat protein